MFCVSIDCRGTFRLVQCVRTFVLLSHAINHEHHTEYGTQKANDGASNNGCNNDEKTLLLELENHLDYYYGGELILENVVAQLESNE